MKFGSMASRFAKILDAYRKNAASAGSSCDGDDASGTIEVLQFIPRPDHIRMRLRVHVLGATRETLRIAVFDGDLHPVAEDYTFMGESDCELARYVPDCGRVVSASLFVPWNLDDIYVAAWHAERPERLALRLIPKREWEPMVAQGDRDAYRNVGTDPYYMQWFEVHRLAASEEAAQRSTTFEQMPLFSVVVPLYNTPVVLFDEMMASLAAQTYSNWECILVNSTPECDKLARHVVRACAFDSRVRVVELKRNLGISLNTNAGIAVAKGDFVCFLDHDDTIEPDLLFEYAKAVNARPDTDLLYCDEDKLSEDGMRYCDPAFKPDFDLDLLRSNNYICHMLCIRKTLLDQLEPNTPDVDGAQDHNLTLEAVEKARHVHHVARILYHWRLSAGSTSGGGDAKSYATAAGVRAVQRHLDRIGADAKVSAIEGSPCQYATTFAVPGSSSLNTPDAGPLVSIVIPSKDHVGLLSRCIDSIVSKTAYASYEIVVVENGSIDAATFEYYDQVEKLPGVRVVPWPETGGFNFSRLVNFGRTAAQGEYILLLNNDTEVLTCDWIERMLGNCARPEVGAVGCKLLYPDGIVQHAGVVIADEPAHWFEGIPAEGKGYRNLVNMQRSVSAVTGACLMTSAASFDMVGGFDPLLPGEYNDVDFCLKLRETGKVNVYLPSVELVHHESASRNRTSRDALAAHFEALGLLRSRWSEQFAKGDPYYNPSLEQTRQKATCWRF